VIAARAKCAVRVKCEARITPARAQRSEPSTADDTCVSGPTGGQPPLTAATQE
jgi:hypothetical protein